MHQFRGIFPTYGWQVSVRRLLELLPGLPNDSSMETLDLVKDLLCFCIQTLPPPRDLTVNVPQPDHGSEVDEDGVEGDVAIDLASGTEGGKTWAGRTSLVQESIAGHVKVCETLGGGVPD